MAASFAQLPSAAPAQFQMSGLAPLLVGQDQQQQQQQQHTHPVSTPDPDDWRYEMRRDMQEILPRLWLGPYNLSRDKEALKAKGITHMLCIRDPKERQFVRCLHPDDFVYHVIEVTESPLQNLIPYFAGCRAFIDSCFAANGSVFIFCSSAISRSPCFVVAYIMASQNWPFQRAYSFVQGRRFCVNPNEGFKHQLKEYEPIWQANEDPFLRRYDDVQILQQGRLKRTMHGDPDEE